MPTKTKLDKVQIELTSIVGSKSISVAIRHKNWTTWDEGNVATVPAQVVTNGWNTFDFEDITVIVSGTDSYGIWVTCPEDGPQWKYTMGPSTYARGFAIWQSTDQVDWDYNFKSYGYDPSPTDPNVGGTGTDQTATGMPATGETLGEATLSIVKLANLTAEYSDQSKGVKLA